MVNPCPSHPKVTTPYGAKGSAWSTGWHDGEDRAAPSGADVVSMWGGTVVEAAYPTSFGSAFGRAVVIDHDKLPDGSPGGWGLYAHLSAENVSVGQRVEAGQKIGDVGTTGSSSGNHIHTGVYMTDHWVAGGGVDPARWVAASTSAPTPPPSGGGDYPTPTSNTVYLSKLKYGQMNSDSAWYLQSVLNGHSLSGGQTLPTTGNYLDETDEEVRLCQEQHFSWAPDLPGTSYVGPDQAGHLFNGLGLTIINDV